jgi:hypothetical protein
MVITGKLAGGRRYMGTLGFCTIFSYKPKTALQNKLDV